MKKNIKQFGLFIKKIERIEICVGLTLLSILVIVLFINCILRYFFCNPLVWAEELAVYCFIWLTFIGASIAFKQGKHLQMGILADKVSIRTKKQLQIFIFLFIGALLIFLIIQGREAMLLQRKMRTIALPVQLPSSYVYALPLVVASVSMLFTVIYFLLEIFKEKE